MESPDGLVIYSFGLSSLRHSDLNLLNWSNVNAVMRAAQANDGADQQFFMYGDSIYPNDTHLRCATGTPHIDKAMNSVREYIEHHYGQRAMNFPFMSSKHKMKICSGMPLEALYFCVQILHNAYTCLYGNITSERMACKPPTFEDWVLWV